jgi:glycosyltransferase involved in cell wall biosynthesis
MEKKKIKLCVIPSTFLPIVGGAEVQCHNFSNLMVKKKLSVHLWNLNKINIKNNLYQIKFFNMYILNLVYFFEYYLNINLNFLLRNYLKSIDHKYKYDIYHFHSLNFKLLQIIRELKKMNKKVVVTFQGADIQIKKNINYGYRLKKKYDFLLKSLITKIDKVHSISENIKKDLILVGVNKDKIFKIPNTVYVKKVNSINYKKDKKQLNLLTVARFAEKKKGFDFIEKLGNQLRGKLKFKWTIIGRDSHKIIQYKFVRENKSFFKSVSEINNRNETFFPHSSLIKHYRNSDIYIHLSRIESFGISIIEAMSANLPILAIKAKGSNELIKKNINGFFFNFKKNNFLNKVNYIKKNKFNLNKLRKYNKIYLKNFDLELATQKMIFEYKKILK